MKVLKRPALCSLLALVLYGCSESQPGNPAEPASATIATVETSTGSVDLRLEVAADALAQGKGLSGRQALARGSGMLFPFDPPRTASFWMKDTPIPLDLLFIRSDGTIAAVLTGKAGDLTPISTGEPTRAVIEISQGEAARLGISEDDRVSWGDCSNTGKDDPLRFCPG